MSQIVQMQPLESRTLFSGSVGIGISFMPPGERATGTIVPTKKALIHGDYVGAYGLTGEAQTLGIEFIFNKRTHGKALHGSVIIQADDGQQLVVAFSGRLGEHHHFSLRLNAAGVVGTITGHATHTGGAFKGSFNLSGAFIGVGSYSVAKP